MTSSPTKRCAGCETVKALDDFNRDNARKDGRQVYCGECQRATSRARRAAQVGEELERRRARGRQWHKDNPEASKRSRDRATARRVEALRSDPVLRAKKNASGRARLYGLTAAQVNAMFEAQHGLCGVCGLPMERAEIDHDHSCCPGHRSCGRCVRGLVCRGCNCFVGYLETRAHLIEAATAYIARHAA